jgi:hypothetical protein
MSCIRGFTFTTLTFKFGIEILHSWRGIVDSVPLELSGFQGLPVVTALYR